MVELKVIDHLLTNLVLECLRHLAIFLCLLISPVCLCVAEAAKLDPTREWLPFKVEH